MWRLPRWPSPPTTSTRHGPLTGARLMPAFPGSRSQRDGGPGAKRCRTSDARRASCKPNSLAFWRCPSLPSWSKRRPREATWLAVSFLAAYQTRRTNRLLDALSSVSLTPPRRQSRRRDPHGAGHPESDCPDETAIGKSINDESKSRRQTTQRRTHLPRPMPPQRHPSHRPAYQATTATTATTVHPPPDLQNQ